VEIECLEVDQSEVAIKAGLAERADELFAIGLAWMAEPKGLNCQAWIVGDYEIPEGTLPNNCPFSLCDF